MDAKQEQLQAGIFNLHRHLEVTTGRQGASERELTLKAATIVKGAAVVPAQVADGQRALQKLLQHAPDAVSFQAQALTASQAAGTHLITSFAALLVDIAQDTELLALLARPSAPSAAPPASRSSRPAASTLPPAVLTASGKAPPSSIAAPHSLQHHLLNVTSTGQAPLGAAGPGQGAPARTPAGAAPQPGSQLGYATPHQTMPAVSTPYTATDGAAAEDGSALAAALKAVRAGGGQYQQPTGVLSSGSPQARPSSAFSNRADNPVYGQDDVSSPLLKNKEYTPSLNIANTTAARHHSVAEPQPNLPDVGDLFAPGGSTSLPADASIGRGDCTIGNDETGLAAAAAAAAARSVPAWNFERPHLTGLDIVQLGSFSTSLFDDAAADGDGGTSGSGLAALDPQTAELRLLDDLLYTFMGYQGKYVRAVLVRPSTLPGERGGSGGGGHNRAIAIMLDGSVDACTQELVERVLPIVEYVIVLQRFIETRSALHRGTVAHAASAALRELLDDWMLTVAQLEHRLRVGQLTLQGLIYHCQAPMASLRLLAGIAAEAAACDLSAAGLLNLLHTRSSSLVGNRAGHELLDRLLAATAAPYFRLLARWLREGVLDDPYNEFMIQENLSLIPSNLGDQHQLAFWNARYMLRRVATQAGRQDGGSADTRAEQLDVPLFLLPHAEHILTTGKYLNAIRESDDTGSRWRTQSNTAATVRSSAAMRNSSITPRARDSHADPSLQRPLVFDPHGGYVPLIYSAHAHASKALLELLTQSQSLLSWLRAIKHYFFMDQGDLMVHLVEAASDELNKPARDISKSRLQSLLELAIKTSSVSSDPYADDLAVELDPRTLAELVRASDPARLHSMASTPSGTPGMPQTPASTAAGGGGPGSEQRAALRLARRAASGEAATGWELLMLSYSVRWPLTLVVSNRQLSQYQLLFRLLFGFKHLERQLAMTWQRLQATRKAQRPLREQLKPAFGLCQKQMYFVQECMRHVTFAVLEPLWTLLESALRKAANVDEVILHHGKFLERAVDGSMLSQPRTLRCLTALQSLGHAFCRHPALRDFDPPTPAPAPAVPAPLLRMPQHSTGGGSAAAARMASAAPPLPPPTGAAAALVSGSAVSELLAMSSEFSTKLAELVAALQEHRIALMQQLDSPSSSTTTPTLAASSGGLHDRREELESLANLIDRIDLNRRQGPAYAALLAGL